MDRVTLIRERLQQAFAPTYLDVIDDSAKHQGHAGSQGGAGHYSIVIAADHFKDKNRVAAHQEIYRLFAELIPGEIHALSIKIIT